jgi:D-tagatose-1,6-bisphosphate aldolase subunit GatZ/KbaZ
MYLEDILSAQKQGQARGITSICSAHPTVLEATLLHGIETNRTVLIESTCNQVNQFGGYTGMTPKDFAAYVGGLADRLGFPTEWLIMGGDHIGPNVWQDEPAASAMAKSHQMVQDYIAAGYCKIHLDASMKCSDDPEGPLPVELAAERTAELAEIAEATFEKLGGGGAPHYVIGTEVPIAGGAQGEDEHLQVTVVPDLKKTIQQTRSAFHTRGLESAWERMIAVVVQPGVEFGDATIHTYDRASAANLANFIEGQPLIYEAHSTDYQTKDALHQMVEDHFAILKVGPALTFAYREAIFALAMMENELFPAQECSNLISVIDQVMVDNPVHWQKYYHQDDAALRIARKYSFSDRIRYYWPEKRVQSALNKLFDNLGDKPLPLSLLSQFLPVQYAGVKSGRLPNTPRGYVLSKVLDVLDDYGYATGDNT